MAVPEQASLPPFFVLTKGMVARFTALDATTGALVGGVTISNMSLSVELLDSTETPASPQPISLLPGPATA